MLLQLIHEFYGQRTCIDESAHFSVSTDPFPNKAQ